MQEENGLPCTSQKAQPSCRTLGKQGLTQRVEAVRAWELQRLKS